MKTNSIRGFYAPYLKLILSFLFFSITIFAFSSNPNTTKTILKEQSPSWNVLADTNGIVISYQQTSESGIDFIQFRITNNGSNSKKVNVDYTYSINNGALQSETIVESIDGSSYIEGDLLCISAQECNGKAVMLPANATVAVALINVQIQ